MPKLRRLKYYVDLTIGKEPLCDPPRPSTQYMEFQVLLGIRNITHLQICRCLQVDSGRRLQIGEG